MKAKVAQILLSLLLDYLAREVQWTRSSTNEVASEAFQDMLGPRLRLACDSGCADMFEFYRRALPCTSAINTLGTRYERSYS